MCRAAQTLRNEPVGPEADLWALGCILYQMLVGKAPFRAASEYLTFERIASGKLRIPPGVDAHAADAIKRLLRPEPAKRLGTHGRPPASDRSLCSLPLQGSWWLSPDHAVHTCRRGQTRLAGPHEPCVLPG